MTISLMGFPSGKGMLCSTCELFTSKDISFVPASTLIETSKISQIVAWYDAHGWKDDLADMLVLDAVIRNHGPTSWELRIPGR